MNKGLIKRNENYQVNYDNQVNYQQKVVFFKVNYSFNTMSMHLN